MVAEQAGFALSSAGNIDAFEGRDGYQVVGIAIEVVDGLDSIDVPMVGVERTACDRNSHLSVNQFLKYSS